MLDAHQAIKVVARRTGLSAHVIRIWEKRYRAVEPERTSTNRRLYSEEQIERLSLLRDVTQAGHSISHVASLPAARLKGLAREALTAPSGNHHPESNPSTPAAFVEESVEAVKNLDPLALDDSLKRATLSLGAQGLLQKVAAPLAQLVGELWRDGTITSAHEHFASSAIRAYLAQIGKPFASQHEAPVVVVATPVGQLHELGALLAAAAAANLGWHVTYLGVGLPATEIAGAVRQSRARVVALSVVYPEDDPNLAGELKQLRDLLPDEVAIVAGGRAIPAYRGALDKIMALQPKDLAQFCATLDELRKPAAKVRA